MRRQRAQHQDPRHLGIAVELGDLADDLPERRVDRHLNHQRGHPDLACVGVDPSLVDSCRVILADQDRRDPSASVGQPRQLVADALLEFGRVRAAIDNGRHQRVSVPARSSCG